MAHKGTNGKGDLVNKTKGISINEYARVHRWVNYHYGKASKCENEKCLGVSKNYQYALRNGFSYQKNIDCFIQLCVSCHKKYDLTDDFLEKARNRVVKQETKDKISNANKGRKLSLEHKKKLSQMFSGSQNPMYGVSMKGEKSAWFGRRHTEDSKKKMCLSNSKINPRDINKIREMVENGVAQKSVAEIFKISRASISRIINKKRYKHV